MLRHLYRSTPRTGVQSQRGTREGTANVGLKLGFDNVVIAVLILNILKLVLADRAVEHIGVEIVLVNTWLRVEVDLYGVLLQMLLHPFDGATPACLSLIPDHLLQLLKVVLHF